MLKTKNGIPAIAALATAVFDNGRRGMPRAGCDCVQCFGYCSIDQDVAHRQGLARRSAPDPDDAAGPV